MNAFSAVNIPAEKSCIAMKNWWLMKIRAHPSADIDSISHAYQNPASLSLLLRFSSYICLSLCLSFFVSVSLYAYVCVLCISIFGLC
jgi:hypothetical protein